MKSRLSTHQSDFDTNRNSNRYRYQKYRSPRSVDPNLKKVSVYDRLYKNPKNNKVFREKEAESATLKAMKAEFESRESN